MRLDRAEDGSLGLSIKVSPASSEMITILIVITITIITIIITIAIVIMITNNDNNCSGRSRAQLADPRLKSDQQLAGCQVPPDFHSICIHISAYIKYIFQFISSVYMK